MRKCLSLLLILMLLVSLAAHAAESRWSEPDRFVEEHAETALYAGESETFDLYYLVADATALMKEKEPGREVAPNVRDMMFRVAVLPKPGKVVRDLQVSAHFDYELQEVLANPEWYMEQMPNVTDPPKGGTVTWLTFIELDFVPKEGIPLDAFYNVFFELKWQGGSEVLYVDRNTPNYMPDEQPEENVHPLNEEDVAHINALAEELRK